MNLKKILLLAFAVSTFISACSEQAINSSNFSNDSSTSVNLLLSPSTDESKVLSFSSIKSVEAGLKIGNIERFNKFSQFIYRGSQPDKSSFMYLKEKFGIKTIVSFRGAGTQPPSEVPQVQEEKKVVESLGLKFVNYAVPFDTNISNSMLTSYFKVLDNAKKEPIFVHCAHGRDRTGTMVAMYKMRQTGVSGKEALNEMQTYGFQTEDYPLFTKQVLNANQTNLKKL